MAAKHHHKKGLFGTGITADDLHGLKYVGNAPETYYKKRRAVELVSEAQEHLVDAKKLVVTLIDANVIADAGLRRKMVDAIDATASILGELNKAKKG